MSKFTIPDSFRDACANAAEACFHVARSGDNYVLPGTQYEFREVIEAEMAKAIAAWIEEYCKPCVTAPIGHRYSITAPTQTSIAATPSDNLIVSASTE